MFKKMFQPIAGLTDPKAAISRFAFIVIALAAVVADQLSKVAAVAWLGERPPVVILPNFLQVVYRTNTGAAFSLFTGHTSWLAVFSVLVSMVIAVWGWRLPVAERGLRMGLGLILGGAIGNLIDRVRLGYVIDFIDVHWMYEMHYPTFNVADSAVCVGMALLLIASLRIPNEKPARSKG